MKRLRNILSTTLTILLLLSAGTLLAESNPTPKSKEVKIIEITGTDKLTFSVTHFQVAPGQTVKIILTTESTFPKMAMAHNLVLLTAEADASAVAQASASAYQNEYIAESVKDQIIAHTALAGKGETVEVTFTAPEENGTYEYICTFPGHYSAGMKGTMTVENEAI